MKIEINMSRESYISERVSMETVGKTAIVAVGDIDVCFREWRLRIDMVKVFHRYFGASRKRWEIGLKPARHHTAEVYQEGSIRHGSLYNSLQGVGDAVALELLSRDGDILCVIYCCQAPTLLHACVVPLAAELHGLPIAGVAVGAG